MLFDLIVNRGKGRMWKTFEAKNLMNGAFIDSKANNISLFILTRPLTKLELKLNSEHLSCNNLVTL